ncbi:MAG: ATP-binding protein, partial [Actinomycetota bacterium]
MAQPLLWGEPPMSAPGIDQAAFRVAVGTVTFLLADVDRPGGAEGGDPGAATGVAWLCEVVEAAVARHGGVRPVEPGDGDSVLAAFAHPSDAVAAALDAQVSGGTRHRVSQGLPALRIALIAAEGLSRDDGTYFGHAVRRGATLRAVAHPGQTVLSRAVRDLVLDRLPSGVTLVDLGIHRLRDLGRPEHVFGLAHRDLPSGFPPPRSLDAVPNNLPSELTSFIGRSSELAQVRLLRRRVRLLTLTGAGGCGKTRLVLQAAADEVERHPDGVWWVELARLEDNQLLPAAVMDAVGLHDLSTWATMDTLTRHLRPRVSLLVLDNCEHLRTACGALVQTLVGACPSLTILATSREPLGIAGETTWRVPSMSVPAEPRREPVDVLRQSEAVRLFVDRARQVRPDFVIDEGNAAAVAQICSDLDGIPLAIELAAARVRMLTPDQIERGLWDRFHLLTGGCRTVLPRHQTLRASIDWSHDLLSDPERVLLRRLSVFPGGWTLEAAEQVCAGAGTAPAMVLDLLTALVDKSLVTTEESRSTVRYRLLETVRQYAGQRLTEEGGGAVVRARHLAWCVEFAERAEPEVMRSGTKDPAFERVAEEIPNLRAAVE